jgi:hypothetical protein
MLTIREAQLAILSTVEVEKFERWMVVHLKKFFPKQCAVAGDSRLSEMIQYGIEWAGRYGITARRDVCKYIDLMLVFGRDFDTDRRNRWASEILGRGGNSSARMRTLLRAAKLRLRNR